MKLKSVLFEIIVVAMSFTFITNTYGEKKVTNEVLQMCKIDLNDDKADGTEKKIKTKTIKMCKIDLNGDKADDFVFLAYGSKTFVILTKDTKYQLHLVTTPNQITKADILSCHKGNYIVETTAGPGKHKEGKKIKIPTGSYFETIESECCSIAYYWKDNTFQKVWTSD